MMSNVCIVSFFDFVQRSCEDATEAATGAGASGVAASARSQGRAGGVFGDDGGLRRRRRRRGSCRRRQGQSRQRTGGRRKG